MRYQVTAVLFLAALSHYDQSLFEEDKVSALHESLNLFDETCNCRWFRKSDMILFLTQSDLFEEKILKKPLSVCFPDYDGPDDYAECIDYIRNLFVNRNKHQDVRPVYTHVVCMINREEVARAFNDVQHIVVNSSLRRGVSCTVCCAYCMI